jgi:hypothetical protein
MAGRGIISEAKPIDTQHIYTLRNGRWQKMFRPINPDRLFSGVNLAESFAEKHAKEHEVDVGLICCADGGTSLDQWMPGEVLFENAVNCALLAKRSSDIVGILWHQGEADCAKNLSATYYERFNTMINELKSRIGIESAPVIIGGLGDFLEFRNSDGNLKFYRDVNRALMKIAEDDPLIGYASAEGLSDKGDLLHFSSEALYEFGLRYYEAFSAIYTPAESVKEETDTDALKRTEMEML